MVYALFSHVYPTPTMHMRSSDTHTHTHTHSRIHTHPRSSFDKCLHHLELHTALSLYYRYTPTFRCREVKGGALRSPTMPRVQHIINTSRGESERGESTHRPVRERPVHTHSVSHADARPQTVCAHTTQAALSRFVIVFLLSFLSWQRGRPSVSCLSGLVLLVPVT